ncbi:MAG: diaminopimelate decarboxylase [Planctomycetes bacterium]|nr:diaminopimelate decarboxylase [Planctomycetota bacterium]
MNTRENKLYFGDNSAEDLCKEFGTPLYVYEEEVIRRQYRELVGSFGYRPLRVHYAVKANYNPAILRILKEEGCGADTVSDWEVRLCLECGFPPENIIFTGDNGSDEEMRYCLEKGVLINAGSLSQLDRLGHMAPGCRVRVRINPDVGAGHHSHCITGGPNSKFGIYHDQLPAILAIASKYRMRMEGIHSHIGTGILDADKFMEAMDITLSLAEKVPGLGFVDFGGGLGIPYREGQAPIDLLDFGKRVSAHFSAFAGRYGSPLELKIEPGRFLVCQAGTLLARIQALKDTPAHHFAGCDSGFNHLIRPMAYGSHHRIANASRMEGPRRATVLGGNICESGDVFTQSAEGFEDREVSELREGDIVAIMDAGAYGMSMSMQYNLRPRPPEVLIPARGPARLIRQRESYEDILKNFIP